MRRDGLRQSDWREIIETNKMDIRIYDVEHGDAILVLSAQNEAVLIDCGYNSTT